MLDDQDEISVRNDFLNSGRRFVSVGCRGFHCLFWLLLRGRPVLLSRPLGQFHRFLHAWRRLVQEEALEWLVLGRFVYRKISTGPDHGYGQNMTDSPLTRAFMMYGCKLICWVVIHEAVYGTD